MGEADLSRFVEAQEAVRTSVVAELAKGRKRSHWMWFVFPQLAGLGRSATAQHYALADLQTARRYLLDPILGPRLRSDVQLVLRHKGKSAHDIFGSPDDLKFRSCVTLFHRAAPDQGAFAEALRKYYGGIEDERTSAVLAGA